MTSMSEYGLTDAQLLALSATPAEIDQLRTEFVGGNPAKPINSTMAPYILPLAIRRVVANAVIKQVEEGYEAKLKDEYDKGYFHAKQVYTGFPEDTKAKYAEVVTFVERFSKHSNCHCGDCTVARDILAPLQEVNNGN